jgi:hypothetical protein
MLAGANGFQGEYESFSDSGSGEGGEEGLDNGSDSRGQGVGNGSSTVAEKPAKPHCIARKVGSIY